ncbi:hypothetical protein RIF29_13847 [Crotalaria pallida]|uniref:CASP-like protein n=1 Tax=Crotalaria pallida TaxID=3830 RepID=A0AAN9FAC3_CROPI
MAAIVLLIVATAAAMLLITATADYVATGWYRAPELCGPFDSKVDFYSVANLSYFGRSAAMSMAMAIGLRLEATK